MTTAKELAGGLRPWVNDDGTMGFELQDGVFKTAYNVA